MEVHEDLRQFKLKSVFKKPIEELSSRKIFRQEISCVAFISYFILLMLSFSVNTAMGQLPADVSDQLSHDYKIYTSTDGIIYIRDVDTATSTITINGKGIIDDIDVMVNINHTFSEDLDIYLIGPDGTRVELATDDGPSQYGYLNTVFDDEADLSITEGSDSFRGRFQPEGQLHDFYGKSISGLWTLEVTDDNFDEYGNIVSWSLIIKKKLPPPIIQSKPADTNDFCSTVFWDDITKSTEHKFSLPLAIPASGTLVAKQDINDYCLIEDVNAMLDISFGNDSMLSAFIISPSDTKIKLFSHPGSSGSNFDKTVFDDEASVSIADGTAPFRGTFKPEGKLSDLIGEYGLGEWKVEITNDSSGISGYLNSWSLTADLTDITYYVECALDSGFENLVSNSGWTIDRTVTFNELDPNQQYWYRAKARKLCTWKQNTKSEFETGNLDKVIVTKNGEVKINPEAVNIGYLPVDVIANPSFEIPGSWQITSNNPFMYLGPVFSWATDGAASGGIVFYDENVSFGGDYGFYDQMVDWTGVDVLKFDYCCDAFSHFSVTLYIGDQAVWEHKPTVEYKQEFLNQTIDVSDFTGLKDLKFSVQYVYSSFGLFDASFLIDNFRTYKTVEPNTLITASIISLPIAIDNKNTWDVVSFDAEIPDNTNLTVDILPASGQNPIEGYENISSDTDISGLTEKTIRLRANLSSNDKNITPVLRNWAVCYTSSSGESTWSNVVSSECSEP